MHHLKLAALAAMALTVTPLVSSRADAQWALQGGDYGVTFGYQTTGSLSCLNVEYHAQPCIADASGLTLWNGTAFAHLSYIGVTNSVTATNQRVGPVDFGTLQLSYGGTGEFTWPRLLAPTALSFGLRVNFMQLDGPLATTSGRSFRFGYTAPHIFSTFSGVSQSDYFSIGFAYPQPALLNYSAIVFDGFSLPQLDDRVPADFSMHANVGLIPEPSTYALMALGLLAVGVVARRRQRNQ